MPQTGYESQGAGTHTRANGRSLDPFMQDGQDDEPPKLCSDEPGLAACYAAAARGVAASGDRAGQAPLRLLVSPAPGQRDSRRKRPHR